MQKKYISGLAFVIAIALIISCATTGPGGKKDLIFISSAQEVSRTVNLQKAITKLKETSKEGDQAERS